MWLAAYMTCMPICNTQNRHKKHQQAPPNLLLTLLLLSIRAGSQITEHIVGIGPVEASSKTRHTVKVHMQQSNKHKHTSIQNTKSSMQQPQHGANVPQISHRTCGPASNTNEATNLVTHCKVAPASCRHTQPTLQQKFVAPMVHSFTIANEPHLCCVHFSDSHSGHIADSPPRRHWWHMQLCKPAR
jgi:hypothetical protein